MDYLVIICMLCHSSSDLTHLLQNMHLGHVPASKKVPNCLDKCRWQFL